MKFPISRRNLFNANESTLEAQITAFHQNNKNRFPLLGRVLYCIATDKNQDLKERFKLIALLLRIEPLPYVLLKVLTETPDRFIAIFKMIDDSDLAATLFKYFVEKRGQFALVWLAQAAEIISDSELSNKSRQILLDELMNALTVESFDQFADICINDLPTEKLAHILLFLKNKNTLQIFIEKFLGRYTEDRLPGACLTLIENMFHFIDVNAPFCPDFLGELLLYKEKEGWVKKAILEQIVQISRSLPGQHYLVLFCGPIAICLRLSSGRSLSPCKMGRGDTGPRKGFRRENQGYERFLKLYKQRAVTAPGFHACRQC